MRYHIVPRIRGVAIRKENSLRAIKAFTNKDTKELFVKCSVEDLAFTYATQQLSANIGDELIVHKRDGSIDSWWLLDWDKFREGGDKLWYPRKIKK